MDPGSADRRRGAFLLAGIVAIPLAVRWEMRPPSYLLPDGSLDAPAAADALLGGSGHEESVERVRDHLTHGIPPRILRALADDGYRVKVNERPRDGVFAEDAEVDYHGGFQDPWRKLIVVSELVLNPVTGRWFANSHYDDVVDHEIGHALAYQIGHAEARAENASAQTYRRWGVSESPEFVAAWLADFAEIPPSETASYRHEGAYSPLRYYAYRDSGGGYERARQETFAEAFAVELRQSRSRSFALFRGRFPRSSAAVRRIVEKRYGRVFPPDQEPP